MFERNYEHLQLKKKNYRDRKRLFSNQDGTLLSITHGSKTLKEFEHFGLGTSAMLQIVQHSYANLELNENIFWMCFCALQHQIF